MVSKVDQRITPLDCYQQRKSSR